MDEISTVSREHDTIAMPTADISGIGEQEIVDSAISEGQRRHLDDINEFAGLDDRSIVRLGVERPLKFLTRRFRFHSFQSNTGLCLVRFDFQLVFLASPNNYAIDHREHNDIK